MTGNGHSWRPEIFSMLGRASRSMAPILLICLALSACAGKSGPVVFGGMDDSAKEVPFVRLVANSLDFDGKRISVIGVLEINDLRRCLYLTREHRRIRLPANCVAIDFRDNALSRSGDDVIDISDDLLGLDGHYLMIQGVYHVTLNGEMLDWSGIIRKVNFLRDWED